jgi:hypothetical protein
MSIYDIHSVAVFGINTLLAMPRQCGWCGMIHGPRCPSVKAIDYYSDGTVKRVEFVKPDAMLVMAKEGLD